MPNAHPIRCRCGKLRGELALPARATHAICYCRDCRAWAHFLGPPAGMLDKLGGTELIAVSPRCVTFTAGIDQLACVSLTAKGPCRWYAACCGTAIGNTPRNIRLSQVGLVHSALDSGGEDLNAVFGPVTMQIFRDSAIGEAPRSAALRSTLAVLRWFASLLGSRVSGSYRINPFFVDGRPRAEPRQLTEAERAKLLAA